MTAPAVNALLPPNDLEAEQCALGAALFEPGAATHMLRWCQPTDFYRDPHKYIAKAILHLLNAGQPVDLFTVATRLRDMETAETSFRPGVNLLDYCGGPGVPDGR